MLIVINFKNDGSLFVHILAYLSSLIVFIIENSLNSLRKNKSKVKKIKIKRRKIYNEKRKTILLFRYP